MVDRDVGLPREGVVAAPPAGVLRLLARHRGAILALGALVALGLLAVLAPAIAPYSPFGQPDIVGLKNRPPSLAHPFGTDPFSRDVFTRVLYGARVSLSVAAISTTVAITLGTAYGAVAGYATGAVDAVMMRLLDAMLSIPRILMLIATLGALGRTSLAALVLIIGLTGWFTVARLVRGDVRALRQRDFVLSARALGASRRRILVRHVLPNVVSSVIVAATLGVANVVMLEAGLSYLGIGVQPPMASWGNIIQDGVDQIATVWWISLFPGLAIVLTVAALNSVGDGLRDALDPRQLEAHAAAPLDR